MEVVVERIGEGTLAECVAIWNEVVEEGAAFPQTEPLTRETGREFLAGQSYAGAARDAGTGRVVGMYVLHPNNVGRCGHLCNASFAVRRCSRGQGVGGRLVGDCLEKARGLGFRIIQFNAVVASNAAALRLYRRMGFVRLGTIPGGFRNRRGEYEDIIPHYRTL